MMLSVLLQNEWALLAFGVLAAIGLLTVAVVLTITVMHMAGCLHERWYLCVSEHEHTKKELKQRRAECVRLYNTLWKSCSLLEKYGHKDDVRVLHTAAYPPSEAPHE